MGQVSGPRSADSQSDRARGSLVFAGPAAGIAGGLAMAAYLMLSGAFTGSGPLAAVEPMGAAFADPAEFEGGGRAVLLGIVLHLGISALVGLTFAGLLPRDFSSREAGVMCIGFAFVVMGFMTSFVVPTANPVLKSHFHDLGGSWVVAHALFGFATGYVCQQLRRGLQRRGGSLQERAST